MIRRSFISRMSNSGSALMLGGRRTDGFACPSTPTPYSSGTTSLVSGLPIIPNSVLYQRRSFRLVDPRPSETAARLAAEAAAKAAGGGVSAPSSSSAAPAPSATAPFDVEAFQRSVIAKTMAHIDDTIASTRQTDSLMDLVQFYCSMQPAKVNLNDIVIWLDNPRYDPYIHCHRQFPLLIAHLIRGIVRMPEGLSSMPSIVATRKVLMESFAELTSLPVPTNVATEAQFVKTLTRIVERHAEHDILMKMATGVVELKKHHNRHRDALQRLREQHISLQKELRKASDLGTLGTASTNANAAENVEELHPVHTRNQGKSETDFARDLLRLQEPLDRFNRFLVEFNFTARQMLDFADRVSHTEGNESPKPTDNCITMKRPSERMSQLFSLVDVVKDAVYDAKQICDSHYGDSPEVTYKILTAPVLAPTRPIAFAALEDDEELLEAHHQATKELSSGGRKRKQSPSHSVATTECGQIFGHICPTVHYIIVELMKNAFRASIERHARRNRVGMLVCDDVPAVQITINARPGLLHSCVCVEDKGTGIRRDHMPYAMSYSYTTAKGILEDEDEHGAPRKEEGQEGGEATMNGTTSAAHMPPLAGFGYGLPMSRTYARCFGGDVRVNSVEGSGTKVFLYLKAANTQQECLAA